MPDFYSPEDLNLPALNESAFDIPSNEKLGLEDDLSHPPRILMLYGSLRERSYSRLLTEEAARIPVRLGAEVRIFDPRGLPLASGSVRTTQGRTLAVMQVSGGSQSFNSVNTLRLLGRWMRMVTIPNQSSVAKAFQEFEEDGRMKPSTFYDRVVDVMEELFKFTLLIRGRSHYLTSRYSERKGIAAEAAKLAAKATEHERT